ncbi:MAG TPA: response regulator transcription factor [Polyangia bacterium]|jgi:two-component system response regulator NreC|nr:response regulator transcription factor [Polyangia bacterium]
MTTLLLIDDRELFREGFRLLLATQPDFDVVGEAASLPAVVEQAEALSPDVIILGQEVDGVGGAALTVELARRTPSAKVFVLGNHGADDVVRRALAAGARGFALKQQPSVQVFAALRQVATGRMYLAPSLMHLMPSERPQVRHADGDGTKDPCDNLSRRERDVFQLLVRGHTNRRIAGLLGISPKTVETHRAHVLRKLGVHSIVDLVRFAARHQLPLD